MIYICLFLRRFSSLIIYLINSLINPFLEALEFEDFSDEDLKKVLLNLVRKEMLRVSESTVDFAIKQIAQRRRLDNFGMYYLLYKHFVIVKLFF